MNETESWTVSNKVAIALGIICIILDVGLLGGALAHSISVMNSEIADKNRTISNLNNQISVLQTEYNNANAIANFSDSATWMNNDFSSLGGFGFNRTVDYAGYVFVVATSGSSFTASVEVSFSLPNGVTYDKTSYLNQTQNTAWFPILPAVIHFSFYDLSEFFNYPITVNGTATYYY